MDVEYRQVYLSYFTLLDMDKKQLIKLRRYGYRHKYILNGKLVDIKSLPIAKPHEIIDINYRNSELTGTFFHNGNEYTHNEIDDKINLLLVVRRK